MKKPLTILVAIVVGVVILWKMFFFQVGTGEIAVLTTFRSSTPPQYLADGSIDPSRPGSLVLDPGLHFHFWPVPFQEVYKYNTTKLQLLEDQLEQIQTNDRLTITVRTYLTWRIQDPQRFFVKLQGAENAEKQLIPLMRDLKRIVSQYRFDQLVNVDPGQLKLVEIETEALGLLRQQFAAQGFGIEAVQFGIRRLVLPSEVTEKVFETMRQTRETMAEGARSSGASQAAVIKAEAAAAQARIKSFAEKRAQAIRTLGDQEAARYFDTFRADESLAIFLRRIETLKKVLAHNSTFVLDSNQLNAKELLGGAPAVEPKK